MILYVTVNARNYEITWEQKIEKKYKNCNNISQKWLNSLARTFIPNGWFGKILKIRPTNLIFLMIFDSNFLHNKWRMFFWLTVLTIKDRR